MIFFLRHRPLSFDLRKFLEFSSYRIILSRLHPDCDNEDNEDNELSTRITSVLFGIIYGFTYVPADMLHNLVIFLYTVHLLYVARKMPRKCHIIFI